MKKLALLAPVLSLVVFACGNPKPPEASPGKHPETTGHHEHEHGKEHGKEHEHGHGKMSPPVKDLHSVLAPLWHSPKGPERIVKACDAAKSLHEKSEATKDAPLVADAAALVAECAKEGRPEFEAKFHAFHERFHVVMKDGPSAAVEPPKPPPPTPAVRFTGGFATPESVLHDEVNDRYLVSNVGVAVPRGETRHGPVDIDNNGFISDLSPDGKITNPRWIEGGKNKVTLNAPKGMAIVKDVLYIADLDTLRMFDLKTGAPKGDVKLEGATFANDVAAGEDGKIYVSDSGVKMEGADFKPTGTDAVWVVEKGKAKPLVKSTDLSKPNGVLVDGKSVLVVTFGSNELFRLDDKGQKADVTKLPKGSLDGIVRAGDSLLVSSWEAQAIFKGKLGGTFEPVLAQLKAPADIGFDRKRSRVLVPRVLEDAVEAYDVK